MPTTLPPKAWTRLVKRYLRAQRNALRGTSHCQGSNRGTGKRMHWHKAKARYGLQLFRYMERIRTKSSSLSFNPQTRNSDELHHYWKPGT